MSRVLTAFLLAAVISVSVGFHFASQGSTLQEQDAPRQQEPDSVIRRDFMRAKLMYSNVVFEGLTVGNFDAIQDAVKELERVTEGAGWVAIDTEEYRNLTMEFKATTRRLREAAETENIDATALRYYQMSTSCIDCHKHLRKSEYDL